MILAEPEWPAEVEWRRLEAWIGSLEDRKAYELQEWEHLHGHLCGICGRGFSCSVMICEGPDKVTKKCPGCRARGELG